MDSTEAKFARHLEVLPHGVCSAQRNADPIRIFVRGKGAYIWDSEGKKYTDYHAAFAPILLGHNDDDVTQALIDGLRQEASLFGSGGSPWEEEFGRLIVESIPSAEKALVVNTGSEATYLALRVARAATGRDKIIVVQGGYNGWHNDVAFNLMDPWERVASYRKGHPMELLPFTSGMPSNQMQNTVAVQFNDLEAVENLMKTGEIAGIILEPVLQNIGVVKPEDGYLPGLRALSDRYGCVLIFDEVKTGFRHGIGGYQSICGVMPDLTTLAKAVANGFPLGIVAGPDKYMQYFLHEDPSKFVLVAGTYNGHFVGTLAGIAVLKKLRSREKEIYGHLEKLGAKMEEGLASIWTAKGIPFHTARLGSAYSTYFMDHEPKNWNDIARNHDMALDVAFRQRLVQSGVYYCPMPTKQCSISFAHTEEDIDDSLEIIESVVRQL